MGQVGWARSGIGSPHGLDAAVNTPEYQAYLDTVRQQADALRPIILRFAREVLENGLMRVIDASKKRGMSGVFNNVVLRSWVMAGRVMLTFESEGGSVTLLGQEEDTRNYQSIYTDYRDDRTENFHRVGLHTLEVSIDAANHMIARVCE